MHPSRLAAVPLLVLALVLAACSASGSDGAVPAPSITTTASSSDRTTTTIATVETAPTPVPKARPTEPERPDPEDVDICDAVESTELETLLESDEVTAERSLLGEDPRFDTCFYMDDISSNWIELGALATTDDVTVGDVVEAYDDRFSGELEAQTLDVGEESVGLIGDDTTFVVVDDGQGRIVVARATWLSSGEAPAPDELAALLEQWLGNLPELLPVGGRLLPGRCADLDLDLVEDTVGDIVLGRGTDSGSGLTCDFYGDDDEYLRIWVTEGGSSFVESIASDPSRWVPFAEFGTSAARMIDGRGLVVATDSGHGVYVVNGDRGGETGPEAELLPEIEALVAHVVDATT